MKRLIEEGIGTAVDICGFVSREASDKVVPYTDKFLYDIKAFDEDIHIKCTGYSNKTILEKLKYHDNKGCKIEIRIPYVPDYNDKQIDKIVKFLSTLNNITAVKVLPYHNYAGSKYKLLDMENTLPTKVPLNEEVKLLQKKVLKY